MRRTTPSPGRRNSPTRPSQIAALPPCGIDVLSIPKATSPRSPFVAKSSLRGSTTSVFITTAVRRNRSLSLARTRSRRSNSAQQSIRDLSGQDPRKATSSRPTLLSSESPTSGPTSTPTPSPTSSASGTRWSRWTIRASFSPGDPSIRLASPFSPARPKSSASPTSRPLPR